jgi:hypothetical protein
MPPVAHASHPSLADCADDRRSPYSFFDAAATIASTFVNTWR